MKAKGRKRERGFLVVLVAIGLACQPAYAGDRKSTGTVQEVKAIVVAPAAQPATLSFERRGTSAVGLFETGYSASQRQSSERENGAGSTHEHKPLTLFRINSQFGEIVVQPVVGQVNGAQFSLGF